MFSSRGRRQRNLLRVLLPLKSDCIVAFVESPPPPPPPLRIVKPAASRTTTKSRKTELTNSLLGSHFFAANCGHKVMSSSVWGTGGRAGAPERATSTSRQDDDRSATEAVTARACVCVCVRMAAMPSSPRKTTTTQRETRDGNARSKMRWAGGEALGREKKSKRSSICLTSTQERGDGGSIIVQICQKSRRIGCMIP